MPTPSFQWLRLEDLDSPLTLHFLTCHKESFSKSFQLCHQNIHGIWWLHDISTTKTLVQSIIVFHLDYFNSFSAGHTAPGFAVLSFNHDPVSRILLKHISNSVTPLISPSSLQWLLSHLLKKPTVWSALSHLFCYYSTPWSLSHPIENDRCTCPLGPLHSFLLPRIFLPQISSGLDSLLTVSLHFPHISTQM